MNETVLIIGDSPFLGVIDDYIHYAIERHPSIGINNAIRKYDVSMHCFQDQKFVGLTNKHPKVLTIAPAWYGDMIEKIRKDLYGSYTFRFDENTEKDIVLNNKLAWCGFTHDYAISYSIMKGFKNIVLIGAADFTGTKHYVTEEEFKYSEKLKFRSKRFIEEICSKRANIYTCNPDSILDIPHIGINKLLENLTA